MSSERQFAEFGDCALKGPFGILLVPLSSVLKTRCCILTVCVHLFNLRARVVAFNQIRTGIANPSENRNPWTVCFSREQDQVHLIRCKGLNRLVKGLQGVVFSKVGSAPGIEFKKHSLIQLT